MKDNEDIFDMSKRLIKENKILLEAVRNIAESVPFTSECESDCAIGLDCAQYEGCWMHYEGDTGKPDNPFNFCPYCGRKLDTEVEA